MYAVDVAYNAYERQLLDTVRSTDLGASLASLSLSTLAATIHDVDVARGASTANTIVSGSHTALTKDALLNQSLGVLQSQMRASRAAQRTLILQRLSLPYENWNSCLALSDVAAFEQAGTLNAALVAVAQSTARASQDNEAKAAQAIPSVVYSTSPLPVALRAYLRPTDPNAAAHRQTALAALKTLLDDGVIAAAPMTVNARLGLLITGGGTDEERIALARKIAEVEADPTAKKALTDALPSH
ncbi:MAG: hypothetical protein QOE79_583 [Sphingomonadales bacterium]|jgi:hypothetical protein|nr:hypothetical protein [Sphingomonadales bacterium]MEA3048948.1 hypothetical protein [Sphingomonadales bacterium]